VALLLRSFRLLRLLLASLRLLHLLLRRLVGGLLLPPAQQPLHERGLEAVGRKAQPLALGAKLRHSKLGHCCLRDLAPWRHALSKLRSSSRDAGCTGQPALHLLAAAAGRQRHGRPPCGPVASSKEHIGVSTFLKRS
jgi:hypothetical protein